MINYEIAFKKPFTDIKNLLIGIALSILPIINLFALGYLLNLSKDRSAKLPEFDNWGDLFMKGLIAFIISVIYSLPALVVMLIGAASMMGAIMTSVFLGKTDAMTLALSQLSTALPLMIVAAVLWLIAMFLAPMALVHYAATNKFESAFDFKKIFAKAFTGEYIIVWLVAMVTYILLTAVLGWIYLIGSAIAVFIGGVIAFTLFGQAYKNA